MSREDLLAELRERIQDNRASLTSFTIGVTAKATSAQLLLRNGLLAVVVQGGQGITSFSFDLSAPGYDTCGKLVAQLNQLPGYQATPSDSFQSEHVSTDLTTGGGPIELARVGYMASPQGGTPVVQTPPQGVQVQHHLFSDDTLYRFLNAGAREHNPNYTGSSVPSPERSLVLMKAAAHCFRALAALAARSKILGVESENFLALAKDQDEKYAREKVELARTLPTAKVDNNRLGSGEAIMGTQLLVGTAMRSHGITPYGSSTPPTPPLIYQCTDDDVEDTLVRLRWERNTEKGFAYFELWRDRQPNIERSIAGRLIGQPFVNQLATSTQYSRMSTSKQVFGIYKYFPGDFFFGTWSDLYGLSGQNCNFVDGVVYQGPGSPQSMILQEPLEPNTDYWYRLYGFSENRDCTPSAVIQVHTKGMRARISRLGDPIGGDWNPASISPQAGPLAGGTTITITGSYFAVGMRVLINGFACTGLSINGGGTSLTCVSPGLVNPDHRGHPYDVVLQSPNGLIDLIKGVWTYL